MTSTPPRLATTPDVLPWASTDAAPLTVDMTTALEGAETVVGATVQLDDLSAGGQYPEGLTTPALVNSPRVTVGIGGLVAEREYRLRWIVTMGTRTLTYATRIEVAF